MELPGKEKEVRGRKSDGQLKKKERKRWEWRECENLPFGGYLRLPRTYSFLKKLFLGESFERNCVLNVLINLYWLLFLEEKSSFLFLSFYDFGNFPKNKCVFGRIPKKRGIFGKTGLLGNINGGLYEKERLQRQM